jgi:hypothetical protein
MSSSTDNFGNNCTIELKKTGETDGSLYTTGGQNVRATYVVFEIVLGRRYTAYGTGVGFDTPRFIIA